MLLNDFLGVDGRTHHGLIDKTNDLYTGYAKTYRDAVDKLRLINPNKYRTQMVEEFIELINLGVIRFPYEYGGQEYLRIEKHQEDTNKRKKDDDAEEEVEVYYLSQDEKLSLSQIDLMKQEITSIYKTSNPENTSVRYALSKDKENKMHKLLCMYSIIHNLYK